MRVVLDTNVLLVAVSTRSKHHWVYQALLEERFELAVTDGILNEYEEKIGQHWHPEVASAVIRSLLELPNVVPVKVSFELRLITSDPDDNKFVDCAFEGNAHYLGSNDNDFTVLKEVL